MSALSILTWLAVLGLLYAFVRSVVYPVVVNSYFKSAKFLEIRDRVQQYAADCNDLNGHIEDLKLTYTYAQSSDYGKAQLTDSSRYNMKRKEWSTELKNRWTHSCSASVAKSAHDQPYKYFCKYFNVEANEQTLKKFEEVLNNFAAAEQGKHLLANERDAIVSSVSDSIPSFILNNHRDRVNKELGFQDISLSDLYFPVYTFQYVSPGGNSRFESKLKFDIKQLEGFINYLADALKFRNSVAGQRSLMTAGLREKIKIRDAHTCQMCGLSTADERNLLLEIDHIIPLSKGGVTSEDNLQTLCWKCNRSKGSKIIEPTKVAELPKPDAARSSKLDMTRPVKSDAAQSSKLDMTRPVKSDAARSAKLDMTRPVKSDAARSPKLDMTRPVKSDAARSPKLDMTRLQLNAVRSAKEYIEYSGYSRDGLIEQLRDCDSYKTKDATIAVDSLNLDWSEQAVRTAKEYIEYSGYSRDGLIEQLRDCDSYKTKDATIAVDSLNLDWSEQAVRTAKEYIEYSGYSRDGLIEQLRDCDSYKTKDATIAVDSLNLDWSEQAVRTAEDYLEYSGYSYDGLIEQLCDCDGYTKAQAIHAAQQTVG